MLSVVTPFSAEVYQSRGRRSDFHSRRDCIGFSPICSPIKLLVAQERPWVNHIQLCANKRDNAFFYITFLLGTYICDKRVRWSLYSAKDLGMK